MRNCIRLISIFLIFFSMQSYAVVDLELTQGMQTTLPVAIVPFGAGAPTDIAAIVQSDLQNSGRFRLLDRAKMSEKPQTLSQINPTVWQGVGMDYIVVGTVKPAADGRNQVTFELVNLYGTKEAANAKPSLLLTKEFLVPNQGMRKLAHHISDLIYEKLTGEKGAFSTHLAYVVVEKQQNIPVRYRLEVADVDGSDPRNVMVSQEPIMSPAWAPDGSKIAYVSFEKGHSAIFVQDVVTGKRRQVTDYPGINGAPAWSPDGNRLAFVLSKGGNPNIYTMDLTTNNLVQRTTGSSIDTEPTFAPDGNSILFTSSRGGGPQLYKVDLAGGVPQRVTYDGNYNASGTFTPDGKSVVLLHQQNGAYHIAVQNLQTGRIDVLTQTGKDQCPSVAPNGSMIVFATRAGARQVLGMVSMDGHAQFRLPARDGDIRDPDWSAV